jgi:hypothetical protein
MDCEAVDEDRKSFLGGCLAEALHEDEDDGRLGVKEACVVAHHDVVEQDVDVGNLVGVKGRHHGV